MLESTAPLDCRRRGGFVEKQTLNWGEEVSPGDLQLSFQLERIGCSKNMGEQSVLNKLSIQSVVGLRHEPVYPSLPGKSAST